MSIPSEIRNRLEKILALARGGVAGEAENAWDLLERLLKQHGYTLDDLEEPHNVVSEVLYEFAGEWQQKLLLQVCVAICDRNVQIWGHKGKPNVRIVASTRTQHAEISVAYSVYKAALQKEMDACYIAFLHVNEIFPESEEPKDEPELTPQRREEMMRVVEMMRGMSPTPVHLQIESKEVRA